MIVKTDKTDFESYLVDAANIKGDCEKVYFPENENDICNILKDANDKNQKVTVSAARTGLNGGSVPHDGILVSLEKLNKVISINSSSKTAVVQPGVTLSQFQDEISKSGLFYPPDPTETNCSIGGTVANNASGARTFKYGSTRNFVEEITVVLPYGEKFSISRNQNFANNGTIEIDFPAKPKLSLPIPNYKMPDVKHSAGYFVKPNMDLIDLFIGSEGTLGIITEIKLRLLDLPKSVISMIIFFNDESDIFSFVNSARNESQKKNSIVDFREIEFFDDNTLSLLKSNFQNIPSNSVGAVWIEQETDEENEEAAISEIEKLIGEHNGDLESIWFALNEKERKEFKAFRHQVPLKVNDIISGRGLVKVGTDTAVPNEKFKEFYEFTVRLIKNNNLDYVVYGHIGNSHLHFNMLPKTESELNICRELYGEICGKSTELGGTISAEHGIGKLKTKYLLQMFGESNLLQMAKLKKILDPNLVLNIGNMIEEKYLQMI